MTFSSCERRVSERRFVLPHAIRADALCDERFSQLQHGQTTLDRSGSQQESALTVIHFSPTQAN
jgi:hypothetical protein